MDVEIWEPYNPRSATRSLFNNPDRSDVQLLVNGRTIYAHRLLLSLGSPVFESMFFGDWKDQREVIEIEGVTSAGFTNAIRYIYGFPIDFDCTELAESYLAADMYLLTNFNEAFFDYIKSKVNSANICLIYEQLMKIGDPAENSLAHVRRLIPDESANAFESETFLQIEQKTLISLLSLEQLLIEEIDLLLAVSKWIDCELQRRGRPVDAENRRLMFEPIKGYILFSALTPEKIAMHDEITSLLASETLYPNLQNKPSDSPGEQPSEQPGDQSNDQASNSPDDQPNNSPGEQSSSQPNDQPGEQPSKSLRDLLSNSPTNQSSDSPTKQPSDQPDDQPGDQPGDQLSDSPDEQPSNPSSDPPTIQLIDQPNDQLSDSPSTSTSNPVIELKTPRRVGARVRSVFATDLLPATNYFYSTKALLSVNRRVFIKALYVTYSASAANLSLKVRNADSVELRLGAKLSVRNGRRCFVFQPAFEVEPDVFYMLQITANGKAVAQDRVCRQQCLKYEPVHFYLDPFESSLADQYVADYNLQVPPLHPPFMKNYNPLVWDPYQQLNYQQQVHCIAGLEFYSYAY